MRVARGDRGFQDAEWAGLPVVPSWDARLSIRAAPSCHLRNREMSQTSLHLSEEQDPCEPYFTSSVPGW